MIKIHALVLGLSLSLGLVACGGDSKGSSNDGSASDLGANDSAGSMADAGSINPAAFVGSCNVTATYSGVTVTVCSDYYTGTAASVKSGCEAGNGGSTTTAFSANHCSKTGCAGTCTVPSMGTINYYYTTLGSETACTNTPSGTWSASCQ